MEQRWIRARTFSHHHVDNRVEIDDLNGVPALFVTLIADTDGLHVWVNQGRLTVIALKLSG